ncbi:hypothetical protein [Bdellovibrio sp.]|uniref:hypothetical protein n=1 Tax=Bdellovibrio sp. TaxID=28201 RepID=UPI0039E5CF84
MGNPVSATDHASSEHGQTNPINKNRRSTGLGKFTQTIRGYFHTSELTREDWERLESKKQIAHGDRHQSVDHTRVH